MTFREAETNPGQWEQSELVVYKELSHADTEQLGGEEGGERTP